MYKLIMAFTLGLAPFFSLAYYDLFSNENLSKTQVEEVKLYQSTPLQRTQSIT